MRAGSSRPVRRAAALAGAALTVAALGAVLLAGPRGLAAAVHAAGRAHADPPWAARHQEGHAAAGRAAVAGPAWSRSVASCGPDCLTLASLALGDRMTMNADLPVQSMASGRVGRKIDMLFKGITHPSGEFSVSLTARVWQFCGTDSHDMFPPASYLCRREWDDWVFELAWTPFGNQTDLCVGVAVRGQDGENVTLRPCGQDARTLWIADRASGTGPCRAAGSWCPWISAADSNFRSPFVLAVDALSHAPADQLRLARLNLAGRTAVPGQLFAFVRGLPGS